MVGELHRAPVSDVAVFTFAEYPVEHACRTEEANMPTMKGCEWSSSHIPLLGKKDSTGLTIGRGIEQQILHLIQWNACVGEYARPRRWDIVGYCRVVGQISEIRFPSQHL